MEKQDTSIDDVVVISDLNALNTQSDLQSDPVLDLTENDIYIELQIDTSREYPQLLAKKGDGSEANPIQYIDQYVSEREEEGNSIPRALGSAILLQSAAIYDHYGSEYAQCLIDRLEGLINTTSRYKAHQEPDVPVFHTPI